MTSHLDRRSALRWGGGALLLAGLAGCTATATTDSGDGSSDGSGATTAAGGAASARPAAGGAGVFDSATLHTLDIAMSEADFAGVLAAYQADQSKEWVEASVTIDGTSYERCGVRLKGNSTIWRVADGASASEYPWLVRLDKYVDGQAHDGVTEIVVRLNNSASALNEALSLDLLAKAGLASQPWSYAAVSAAGATPVLRLILEHPSDPWAAREFGEDGVLYKAEATSNYDYLGDEPSLYDERFDVEAGEDDLAPLIEFLKWVNEIDDAGFAADLSAHVDVAALASYLALEDLIDNYDAIDGPGNNSYLWWAQATDLMTVVGWDHNLTFGVTNRPGGQGGGAPGGPGGMPAGGANRGNQSGNVLARRFEADSTFAAQKSAATERLRAELYTSGYAAQRLSEIAAMLTEVAGHNIGAETITSEKAAIATYLA